MSYLYRTGNGRNNIAFTTTANSSTKYLRRTSTGRNNIVWTTIPAGSTYNILQRNGTGRNNILWANLNIPKPVGEPTSTSNVSIIFAAADGSTVLTSGDLFLPFIGIQNGISYGYGCRITLGSSEDPNGLGRRDTLNTLEKNLVLGTAANRVGSFSVPLPASSYNGTLTCWGDDMGANLWGMQNVKKITIWQGSEYITFHTSITVSLGSSAFSAKILYTDYKTNISISTSGEPIIQANQIVRHFSGKNRTITFSNTW